MGRAKDYPGWASGFQQKLALLRQVYDKGVSWRRLSQRSGYLARPSRPWAGLAPLDPRARAPGSEPHLMKGKWS